MQLEYDRNFCYPFKLRIPILTSSHVIVENMHILDETFSICRHRNIFSELLFCLNGELEIQIPDLTIHLSAGEYIVIPPNVWHQIMHCSSDSKQIFCFNFDLDLKKDLERKNAVPQEHRFFSAVDQVLQTQSHLTGMDACGASEALERIITEFQKKEAGWISSMQNNCLDFFIRIFRNEISFHQDPDDLLTESNLSVDILRYIADHYRENIKLEDIAAAVHASPRHACRVVESCLGINMRQALHSCRINTAKDLLQNTNQSTADIAASVGYLEPDTFSRWFKRLEGCTISQFRAKYKQD